MEQPSVKELNIKSIQLVDNMNDSDGHDPDAIREEPALGAAGQRSVLNTIDILSLVGSNQATLADDPIKTSVRNRFELLFKPIYFIRNIRANRKDLSDTSLHMIVIPDAFRMWFNITFLCFTLLGIIVSHLGGNLDLENNPILHRFGYNNICVYFDDPPFVYFAAFLWTFIFLILVCYEMTDFYRIYDSHKDNDGILNKCEYNCYKICNIYESISFALFIQVFAVQSRQNLIC